MTEQVTSKNSAASVIKVTLVFSMATRYFDITSSGLSMLGGVTAFVVLWGYNMTFQTFLREDKAFVQFITSRKFIRTTIGQVCIRAAEGSAR